MDFSSINPALLIASLMVSATPILLAAIGEAVVEKSGVLNLGVEGMMIVGAVVGFIVAVNTDTPQSMPARMAIMAITTSNSINVKPALGLTF